MKVSHLVRNQGLLQKLRLALIWEQLHIPCEVSHRKYVFVLRQGSTAASNIEHALCGFLDLSESFRVKTFLGLQKKSFIDIAEDHVLAIFAQHYCIAIFLQEVLSLNEINTSLSNLF